MWSEPECQCRHAGDALQFTSVTENRFDGSGKQVAGNQHAAEIITGLRQGGSMVKARHQDDQIWWLAPKHIVQSASDLIGGGAGVVMFACGRGGHAVGLIAANRAGDHALNGRG